MIEQFKNFKILFNKQMIIVIILSILSTLCCTYFKIEANLPISLIGISVIFPIVFSINASYIRRENVLKNFAEFKANMVSLLFARRDWINVPETSNELLNNYEKVVVDILNQMNDYFKNPSSGRLHKIYELFSEISISHEKMRLSGIHISDVSRANQYLNKMLSNFEQMRTVLNYRTPVSLRAYSNIFLNLFPIIFAPYFAYITSDSSYFIGLSVAFLYSIVLVSLNSIQIHLENPYDGIGLDDISLDVSHEYEQLLKHLNTNQKMRL